MRFFAILKDSFREAVDAKVFYVMVGLSAVLTLLVLSISFQPADGKEFMQLLAGSLNGAGLDFTGEGGASVRQTSTRPEGVAFFNIGSVQPLDGAREGPDSPYRVTVIAHCMSAEAAAKLRAAPAETEEHIRKTFGIGLGSAENFRIAEVTKVQLAPAEEGEPRSVAFQVETQPTSATRRLWPHHTSVFFGTVPLSFLPALPLGVQILFIEDYLVNGIGAWVAVLLSVVITAFFIPNMLRKGTVDLLLVKPIHRTSLLCYKYVGGLVFIFLNTTVAVGGVWLALGLRSGIWAPGFLLVIFVLTFFFAILYAVSTLFGTLTQSPIVAILMTCGAWFSLYIVGQAYTFFEVMRQQEERAQVPAERRITDGWWVTAVNTVHFVLPRTKDLDRLTSRLLAREVLTGNQVSADELDKTRINWGESLTVSLVFIGLMLGLSCWRFATKDY